MTFREDIHNPSLVRSCLPGTTPTHTHVRSN